MMEGRNQSFRNASHRSLSPETGIPGTSSGKPAAMGSRTYYYGKGYRTAGFGSLVAAVLSGLAWLLVPREDTGISLTFGIFALVLLFGGLYVFINSRVTSVTAVHEGLTVKNLFASRTFRWEHVLQITYSLVSESFVIRFRSGKPVRISRYMANIEDIIGLLDHHMDTVRFSASARNVIDSLLNTDGEEE